MILTLLYMTFFLFVWLAKKDIEFFEKHIEPHISPKCPYCGGIISIEGWDEHGNTIYSCKDCGKEWI